MKREHISCAELDWMVKYGVYALNTSTMMFENTSIPVGEKGGIVYCAYGDVEDEGFIEDKIHEYCGDKLPAYTLYDASHRLCGFVIDMGN